MVASSSAATVARLSSQRMRRAPPGSSRPKIAGLAMLPSVMASATWPACSSDRSKRCTSIGPNHSPRKVMKAA